MSKDIQKILISLHPLERKVLPYIQGKISAKDLANNSGLQYIEVMRALQWLQNKKVCQLEKIVNKIIDLDENGKIYSKNGLPEKRLFDALKSGKIKLKELQRIAKLSNEEVNISLGVLRQRNLIALETGFIRKIDNQNNPFENEQKFLNLLPLSMNKLTGNNKIILNNLQKRNKIIILKDITNWYCIANNLTAQLKTILNENINLIDKITPNIIKERSWINNKFRSYDVISKVPKLYAGKKQPYRAYLDHIRQQFMALGFKEMFGPIVESDFWDMDALFMPQFHSARDIHQAYYIKNPKYAELPLDLIKKVQASHEHGSNTGSKGWNYKFDIQRTKRLLLRTQGTACSARMLANKNLQIPGKYFGITRCLRYDVIDPTHNVDFFQTEGIVIDEGLNFQHLKGLLRLFAEKFAETNNIKIKPGYFPFTEPSAELYAKHPKLGWIELGGSGIFRPEVTAPFNIKEPVLAWGLGIDRIAMVNMNINDIRELFSQDLSYLRS